VRHLLAVELVAPRRAAQRLPGVAPSVRSTRTGLSQRDKHPLQETDAPLADVSSKRLLTIKFAVPIYRITNVISRQD